MQPIKRAYCRIYQKCFHIAIPFLPYRKPKILKEMGAVPGVLAKKKISSVLLVTDESIRSLGLSRPLEQVITESGIQLTIFEKTVANPTSDNVEEALELYKANDCQALIGMGGGSSIDCAKAVGARVAYPNKKLADMEGILKVNRRLPLLFAIPTTAGTGSETTLAAVIVDSSTRHKYPINSFPLIPRYAVLDPEVTVTLPPFLTATTGMDALTHAVEAYIGRSTTRGTRSDAVKAVRLIFANIRNACQNGSDRRARKNMLYAAYLAGCAFTKSYVGYVHAVAHSLGGKYNVPHGLANAVLLPHVLTAYGDSAEKKLTRLAQEVNLETAEEFIQAIRDMQRDLGIPEMIPEIKEEDIPLLAAAADREGNPLYPVPKLMNARELEQFYYCVMPGGNHESD